VLHTLDYAGPVRRPLSVPKPSLSPPQEGDDGEHEKYEEQHFRNAGRSRRDSAEAENRRDNGDNEKYDCVMKHVPVSHARGFCVGVAGAYGPLRAAHLLSETAPLDCRTALT
jgi:hypothetical protein